MILSPTLQKLSLYYYNLINLKKVDKTLKFIAYYINLFKKFNLRNKTAHPLSNFAAVKQKNIEI